MNVNPSSSQLTIREYPFTTWIVGLFLLLAAGTLKFGFPQYGLQNAVVMAVLGLICILISQITTIHADKTTGILSIKKRRLFLLVSTKEIPLNEVADCRVQSMRGSSNHGERHSNFRVAIIKKSGEIVPLHSWYSNGYGQKAQIVRRLAAFLGLAGAEDKPANLFQAAMQAQVVHTGMLEGLAHAASAPGAQMEQKGVTAGVAWSIERHFVGAQKVTRWICPAFTWPGHFLLIFQKPKGSPAASGGIMSAWVKMVLQQIVSMYGFLPGDMPGFETASGLPTNAALDADFSNLSSAPGVASGMLNGWVVGALQRWAQRHPMHTVTPVGEMGQLAILFSPRGLYLSILSDLTPTQVNELVDLGVEIIRNQAAFQSVPPPDTVRQIP